tara:strand:+ start:5997 stop:6314 length:318 start_codon:yes stop_codon:yes gene_type:complete
MTPEEIRQDGIRSYELAIREARKAHLKPTEAKLWDAIQTLRQARLHVMHVEGEGIASIWEVGPLGKIGYFEILRLAQKVVIPERQMDQSMVPLREWPDLSPTAFR